MFVILLKFSANKAQAGQFMVAHREWLKQGFDEGVFALAGSLQPNAGGGILAHNASMAELQQRISKDPFVEHDIVTAEILEITSSQADDRLKFLAG